MLSCTRCVDTAVTLTRAKEINCHLTLDPPRSSPAVDPGYGAAMTRGWVSDLAHNELSDTASASTDTDKSTMTFHVNIMPTCDVGCESEQASARAKRDSRSVRGTEQRQHEHTIILCDTFYTCTTAAVLGN